MLFLVAFDMKTEEKQVRAVNLLKKMGNWARINPNLWVLRTENHTRKGLRDILGVEIEDGESVFIADISYSTWSTKGIKGPVVDFLNKYQKMEDPLC